MGKITASCNHEISSDWFSNPDSQILVKGESWDGSDAVYSMVVCPECRKIYEEAGIIIEEESI